MPAAVGRTEFVNSHCSLAKKRLAFRSEESVYAVVGDRRVERRALVRGAPAEMVLRLLILKHVRNWSYEVLEREVRANLVYRDFTRVGGGKTPDAKTMGRWGLAVGPEVIKRVHERLVAIAQAEGHCQTNFSGRL